jgi:hypothetical protein
MLHFQKLDVYQRAIEFLVVANRIRGGLPKATRSWQISWRERPLERLFGRLIAAHASTLGVPVHVAVAVKVHVADHD